MAIIAFAATSSTKSINKKLLNYALSLVDAEYEILDLNNYELPLFSEDKEAEIGHPQLAQDFLDKIKSADSLVISYAEHNGTYSAAYKNLFDWCSRINPKLFQNKPIIMLATSPGKRGAQTVLAQAVNSAPFFAGQVKAHLSVPSFYDNYDEDSCKITNAEINKNLKNALAQITA